MNWRLDIGLKCLIPVIAFLFLPGEKLSPSCIKLTFVFSDQLKYLLSFINFLIMDILFLQLKSFSNNFNILMRLKGFGVEYPSNFISKGAEFVFKLRYICVFPLIKSSE